ncbi:MAG: DNA-directed RNA polymerase subunit L [Nanoarchaeota archaeon]
MNLKVVEKSQNKIRIEVAGECHTLLNLLRETAWKEGAKQASYMIQHPYLSQPEIIIYSNDPKKVLIDSSTKIESYVKEFSQEFKRALGK